MSVPTPSGLAQDSQARVYFLHGLKAREEGRFLVAERLLRRAVELEPDNADFHFELGNLYLLRQDFISARQELEQTLMIAPEHLAARYNLGLSYRELGFMAQARDQFERILEIDPQNSKALLQIGYTYQEEGFFEEARAAFEEAHQRNFADPEPLQALEDLEQLELGAQERSNRELERSFLQGEQFLASQRPSASLYPQLATPQTGAQPNGKQALIQAGALLIQELLAKRSSGNEEK